MNWSRTHPRAGRCLLAQVAAADDDEVCGVVAAGHLEAGFVPTPVRHINQIKDAIHTRRALPSPTAGLSVWSSLFGETFRASRPLRLAPVSTPLPLSKTPLKAMAPNARHDKLWAIVNDESGDEQTRADTLKTIKDRAEGTASPDLALCSPTSGTWTPQPGGC